MANILTTRNLIIWYLSIAVVAMFHDSAKYVERLDQVLALAFMMIIISVPILLDRHWVVSAAKRKQLREMNAIVAGFIFFIMLFFQETILLLAVTSFFATVNICYLISPIVSPRVKSIMNLSVYAAKEIVKGLFIFIGLTICATTAVSIAILLTSN